MDRKHLGIGLVAIAGVGAVVLASRKSKSPLVSRSDRVVLIGDSLGVGLRKPLQAMAMADGVSFSGQACGGTMIRNWTEQHASFAGCTYGLSYLRDARPTVVLVSLGTNDAYATVDQIEAERPALERLLQAIVDMGARPIWVDPPKLEAAPNIQPVLAMIYGSQTAAKYGMQHFRSDLVDVHMSGDKIHPTPQGYEAWSRALWNWLRTAR